MKKHIFVLITFIFLTTATTAQAALNPPVAPLIRGASGSVILVWDDPNSTETGYVIERREDGSTGSWVGIADNPLPVDSKTYLDTGNSDFRLDSRKSYQYRIRAIGPNNTQSINSEEVSGVRPITELRI